MKQTSLLDSFIKRQKKQQPNNDEPKIQPMQSSIKKNVQSKVSVNNKWTTLDSDQQGDYLERCKQKASAANNSDKRKTATKMEIQNQSEQMQEQFDEKINKKTPKKTKIAEIKKQRQDQNEQQTNPLAQFTDATPIWAQKQYCKDANMRPSNHPQYDPTTLHVPDDAWPKLTAPMKQFWKIKSVNFDKIILFKLGKFYELFYDDAMIGNQYLDLKYMGTKMHAGFPQKTLDKYVRQFVKLGFKTVIVQQMETPDQMNERIKNDKAQGRKSEKTINRQVTQILTKGTIVQNQDQKTYLPNYLLSLRIHGQSIAYALLEISSNQILLGIAENMDRFKTILFQTRPVQVIFDPDNVPFQMVRMLEKSFLQMQISRIINKNNLWHPLTAICQLDTLQKEGKIKKSRIFSLINNYSENNKNLCYATLSGMFDYLKKVFKFQYVINTARFAFYQKEDHARNMVLDSQALQHLEIFETAEGQAGSLFQTIDRTKTKFGKRLLRRWLMSPLMNIHHINQRLNAIQDIQNLSIDRQKITSIFRKLPDLDKKVNKLYHYAIKSTSASKAIYFEDVNTSRLKEFRQTMEKMQEAWDAIQLLRKKMKDFRSSRLKQLLNYAKNVVGEDEIYYEDEDDQSTFDGLLPDIIGALQQFKTFVKWQKDVPIPQKGLAATYDAIEDEIQNIKTQFQNYIESVRYEMGEPNLKYVHTKQRYEIQIPQKSEKRRPKDFQFSSKRAGFSRYITPTTKQYVKTLEKLEETLKQQMGLFIGFFFEQFKKKQKIWQRYIDVLAQIDCFLGLSEYSFLNSKIRPQFTQQKKFQIIQAKHPCLLNIDFIPNNIVMDRQVMLLTGPNMGGKSTTLRTACTCVILAQIGCYVPAQSYECETIDRIFTRIGASDKLQLGKSTFFIEMEETKSVLTYGTHKSLAIIDELGRGTSTFDGMSIAYSVLRDILFRIRCYCMFATHYHMLIGEFQENEQVKLMMMDSQISQDQLIFLYKLVPGHVQQSFGINVAKLVGINPQTISISQEKAGKMTHQIHHKRKCVLKAVHQFLNTK